MKVNEAERFLELVYENKDSIELDNEAISKILNARSTIYKHYKDNPKEFIENFIKIVHFKTNEYTPFILRKPQLKVMEYYSDNKWIAIPKARQLGITTLTNALALHHSIFVNNAFVLCMAVKVDNASENLERIRSMFNTIPDWLRAILIEWNDKDHKSNASQWTFKSLVSNNKSTIEVASAASEDGTRGKQVTFAHWTETAFSDIANKVFTSMSPALRRRPDSRIVMESTGNGATGLYYEICMGMKEGFTTVFLPWYEDDEYRKEGEFTETDRKLMKTVIGGEIDHLDDSQLLWYKHTSLEMGINSCQQEYPNTVEQVFLSTNKSFFATETILKIEPMKPLYYLNYNEGFIIRDTNGPCTVWEAPISEYEYLMSIDSSEGVIDPSSINVFNPNGEEVAYWTGKYNQSELPRVILALAKHYNNAWIMIESNGIGASIINSLKNQYFYQYIMQYEGKYGFRTSVVTKPLMLATLQTSILENKLKFRNNLLGEEMKTFQADTMKALKGDNIHDDAVISAAIGAFIFNIKPPKIKVIREKFVDYSQQMGIERPKRKFTL